VRTRLQRFRKEIEAMKPYLFDDKINPQVQALQQQAQRLTSLNGELMTKLADASLKIRGREERRDIEAFKADTERQKMVVEFLAKTMLSEQQRAQMDHEIEISAHQHIYDTIQQVNEADLAPTPTNGKA